MTVALPASSNNGLPWQGKGSSPQVDAAVVAQAQDYLNEVQSLKASFTQIAPDGALASGTLYLERPGKMRWQYDPPVPVIMLSRGTILRYYDYELDQVSDIPIQDTLAGFLAKKHVDFNDPKIQILYAFEQDGAATLRITQKETPDEGELAFEFETTPYKLRNILLKDAKGEETNISLSNAELNLTLDDELFEFIGSHSKRRNR